MDYRTRRLPATATTEDRFWAKVVLTPGCWLWDASLDRYGYGRLVENGRHVYAHRFSYGLLVGRLDPELVIDHLCRVRNCVNPAHLELVPAVVNVERGFSPPAQNRRKATCDNGHPLSGENLVLVSGRRCCRTCTGRVGQQRDPSLCGSGRHPWTADNLDTRSNGQLTCSACRRESGKIKARRRRDRLRAAGLPVT